MSEHKAATGGGRTARPHPPLKVMIIDPHTTSRTRLKETLRGLDMVDAITERASPHGLLDILVENAVDVIMIDQEPGAGNVYDIVKLVRSKPVAARCNFVLMSDALDEQAVHKGRSVGIRGFLAKPFDIRGLEKALSDATPAAADAPASREAKDTLRETLDKLRQVSLFTGFSDTELVRLLRICKSRNVPAGQYVFHEGEKGDSLFVIASGRLDIRKRIDDQDKVLVNMRPGDCFGEIAIIDAEPRSADAVAATDCTVIEVHESVVNNNEDVLSLKLVRQLAILLAKKLRAQSK